MVLVAASGHAAPVTLDQAPSPPAVELPAPPPAPAPAPPVEARARPRSLAALPEASGAQAHAFDARTERPIGLPPTRATTARPDGGKPAQAPPASGPSGEGTDFDPDLKEAAKAARQWVEESVPWARSTPKDADDSPEQRAPHRDATGPEQAAPGQYPGAAGNSRGPRVAAAPAEFNLVGEILRFAKDVLGHPLVWLVVALIVIGSAGMSMTKRRSK
jgi:hypothetical protein